MISVILQMNRQGCGKCHQLAVGPGGLLELRWRGGEGAAGPWVGSAGCPAPGPLPLIWAAARVVPCPSPTPTPGFLSRRMFPLLSGRFRRLMGPKHVSPLKGMKFWEERNLGLGSGPRAGQAVAPLLTEPDHALSQGRSLPLPWSSHSPLRSLQECQRRASTGQETPSLPTMDMVQPELFGTWTPGAWGGWPMLLWLSPAGLPRV